MRNPKIVVLGHAGHGKDQFTEYLVNNSSINLRFKSSSMFCIELFLFDLLKDKYGYNSPQDCYNDRGNIRAELHTLIQKYNSPDKSKLTREIFRQNDIYVGLRSNEEYQACVKDNLFDLIFWVDRSKHKPPEGKDSFDIEYDQGKMIYVDNNGTLVQLRQKAAILAKSIGKIALEPVY